MNEIQLHLFIFPAFLSLFLLWSIKRWLYKPDPKKKSPPSPPKLPIIGHIHQLGSLPHQSLHSLAQKYGPLMLLHFGRVPVLVVSSADAASEILKTHDLAFASRPDFKAFKKLMYDGKNITFSPYGEYWRKMKSMFALQLLNARRVQSFRPIREDETALLVKRIGESLGTVNLSEMFAEVTNDVICRSAFGTKYRVMGNGKQLMKLLVELMELLGSISIGDFVPWLGWIDRVSGLDHKLKYVGKEVDDFLEHVIRQRVEARKRKAILEKGGESFLDVLLEIYDENAAADSISIGRDNIKALILDVIEGGSDTISTTLEWVMTELLRHPTVMKILQKEVREIVKDKKDISEDDIGKMQYLKAVIKESFRYHPPAPLLAHRVAREDVKVKSYDISKGTLVMVNVWSIGRDPCYWDEPEKFKPERFLTNLKESSFGWIPFGAGRRGCPGMTYSMAMIELLVANIVHKFDWKLPKGVVLDMTERAGITIHRATPLLALASKAT
ncbi:cytochrome P450 71A8-like [Salvia miltiorrhiza]|uniref:cytochrome P450 71A8-like n=1 Tax=Salvia miltiorrhiza TaxID=226208 RepID=UPI0025AD4B99|nr:cytochrome P450 71A8-like [Salvia miltiorrhiza]